MNAPAPPEPDHDSGPFWAALREERIVLQRCAGCDRLRFPPIGRCPWCREPRSTWTPVDGRGRIYSWTVVHRAFDPTFADDVPYVVATVDLDDGPRIALRCAGVPDFGTRVSPVFVRHDGWTELRVVPDA